MYKVIGLVCTGVAAVVSIVGGVFNGKHQENVIQESVAKEVEKQLENK